MARALPQVHRYPDSHYRELWDELARHHRARPEEITLGCGSNDILRMAADALFARTKTLVQASPTFEALAMYVRRAPEAKVVSVPLRADYAHDLDAMLAKAREGADAVYLCNPNNPTATITPRPAIERFLAELPRETFVLIDEAYHHFAIGAPGYESFADRRVDDPRVLVLRTFSKVYGLAGLRLGYAVERRSWSSGWGGTTPSTIPTCWRWSPASPRCATAPARRPPSGGSPPTAPSSCARRRRARSRPSPRTPTS